MKARVLVTSSLPVLLLLSSTLARAKDPTPPELWSVDLKKLTHAEQTLALSLQGLISKKKPAIWIRSSGMNALLLEEMRGEGTKVHDVASVWDLVEKFRSSIRGYIVYDLKTDSINVATSLCGPRRAVAVDGSIVDRAKQAGLREILDVRGIDEVRAFAKHSQLFSSKVVVVQDESKHAHLRDWAVHQNAFCFYGVGDRERIRILRKIGRAPNVFGWEGEHDFVRSVSQSGGTVLPADWSHNLSTLSRLTVAIPRRPRRYPEPAEKGERIVAFVMSDGDNIQWMGGGFVKARGFWASPHRGTFPMTWEMAPILSEVAPRALRHFYRTASTGANLDDFITGPSGAGYSFPHYLPDRSAFAKRTAKLMKKSRLSVVTVLNSRGTMQESLELLEQREVLGAIYKGWIYDSEKGRILWHRGKPCVSYRYLLWEPKPEKSPEGVARAIGELPADPTNDSASYALINVHAWSFKSIGGPMEAVKRCIDLLPPKTRVVTAEQFVILLRNHFGKKVSRSEVLPAK